MSDNYFEFQCPKCFGSHFGRHNETYHCHDEYNRGCHWDGPQSECSKYPSAEAAARHQMQEILENFGLQIALKTLVDSLEELIKKRGSDYVNQTALKGLKDVYKGYLDRYEPEIPDDYDFDIDR